MNGPASFKRAHRLSSLPLLILAFALTSKADTNALKLWYRQPATKWTEALPIGNGRMGAMIFGGTTNERIQFNEDTLWRGAPHDYVRAGAGDRKSTRLNSSHG